MLSKLLKHTDVSYPQPFPFSETLFPWALSSDTHSCLREGVNTLLPSASPFSQFQCDYI